MDNTGYTVQFPQITKSEFIEYMEVVKKTFEKEDALTNALNNIEEQGGMHFLTLYTQERSTIIKMLERIMCTYCDPNYGSDIEYFIYELNWGKDWKEDSITRSDGTPIVMYDESTLYDHLVEDYWYRANYSNNRTNYANKKNKESI